jgi:Domain of unknown function (DUF4252)
MKKYMAILVMLICSQAGFSQSIDKLFREFSNKENVNRVTIGNVMMKLSSMFTETMGVEGIEVFEMNECTKEVKEKLKEAVRNLKDSRFETMVTSKENENRTRILIRIDQDMIRELVVLTTGKDNALIRIKGKIKPSDIEKVVKEHRNGC